MSYKGALSDGWKFYSFMQSQNWTLHYRRDCKGIILHVTAKMHVMRVSLTDFLVLTSQKVAGP